MATRIRTLNFLPEIFQTTTNSQFLQATLDQLTAQPSTKKIEGYIGSKFGYGVNAKDKYVTEPTKIRTDYQLDPGVVFLKENDTTANDFISYPGIVDALMLEGGITDNNSRLFTSQFYSWDSFTDLDKIINFNQYYWLPEGPERVIVASDIVYNIVNFTVISEPTDYLIYSDINPSGTQNPTLTLLRGGTYTFAVEQSTQFWIQGEPGVTGYSKTNSNIQTRDVYGVVNNGATNGEVTFTVPLKNALDEYNFPLGPSVDVVSTIPYSQVNGSTVSQIGGIDGVTALDGLTVMFYNTGEDVPENSSFYEILIGPSGIIQLIPNDIIPTNQTIIPIYGLEYGNRDFYRNVSGYIELIPYNSAILDELYYQDGSVPNKVGIIRLVDSNITNEINVDTQILGKKNYTSPNGVVFTNGLKVLFQGNIYPETYNNVEYYVEGVGNAIELIPVTSLVSPGLFSQGTYIPWDTAPYDVGNYDSALYIPVDQDYITIARNAINRNAWSRSNRWFHIDVINASATYNNDPTIATSLATIDNKAKRPIIEFYPNLRLFESGVVGKDPIDFIDTRTTDALSFVAGQQNYYPDVAGWSTYNANISSANQDPTVLNKTIQSTVSFTNQIVLNNTTGLYVNDTISVSADIGGLIQYVPNTIVPNSVIQKYYITEISGNNIVVSTEKQGSPVVLSTATGPVNASMTSYSTRITIATTDVNKLFKVGQYIIDTAGILPDVTYITDVSIVGSNTVLVVGWDNYNAFVGTTVNSITGTTGVSVVTADTPLSNYALFEGARVVFAVDDNLSVRNKIYVARFSQLHPNTTPVITLTEAPQGDVLPDEQTAVYRGYYNQGKDFYFDGLEWFAGQQKLNVNQAPYFDIFDSSGISFSDKTVYVGTSFTGSKLFSYGLGVGFDDPILGFPLRYSSVDNVGDISFDVTLNSQTFDYVDGTNPKTQNVNTGYVYNYTDRLNYVRQLGWQTAVSPSVQYQIFEFDWYATTSTNTFNCDVSPLSSDKTNWPIIQVYINNNYVDPANYTVTSTDTSTTVTIPTISAVDTVVQILILSNQVSTTAYYGIPINLSNNPFNEDVTTVNVGDIRGQYQSIYYNNPNTSGEIFGPNNYRDLGNMVPWGNKIIQNSASLALPGTFLRKQSHNLFNALLYNSRQYITFKTLLVDTVNNTEYTYLMTPAQMLDGAMDQITVSKTDSEPFFWSDMLPSKSAYVSNTYSFANSLDVSIYPLTRVYNFSTANYYSVLVYLIRNGVTTQLITGVDYTVSTTAPSLTVTTDLLPNDQIVINEYNQTYGSFVPNTPTKLGLYPATIPSVALDTAYSQPTYFIVGHDGSYTKLYGNYDPQTNTLDDFRDQVLLEYETRVYNNLKLSNVIPVELTEILPGFFRDTDYTYDEFLQIYSESFLNWVGENRINYKKQFFNKNNQFTYNYDNNSTKVNNTAIEQGYFRGLYLYYYDTSTPDQTPWEMIGYQNEPSWWTTRYGMAPYTSDNLVLWGDMAAGIDWNNGNPVVIPKYVRDRLLDVIPVDSDGNLLSPFESILGNYNRNTFNRDWKVGDVGPAEFAYRRSSTWAFDLMRILALTRPAEFYNLAVDVDNYKYNVEFNQFLVNNRSHLTIGDILIYGNGTPATSYINWIVDYEKQVGLDATTNITTLLDNLDVRLVYRLAGFSDKDLLQFYVEKSSANSNNSSLLIPDESYQVLLYDNQPFDRIVYSGVVVQITENGYKVFGNSQTNAYFKVLVPKNNGIGESITVENLTVKIATEFYDETVLVPYGTEFYSVQEVAQFINSYGKYLETQGLVFEQIENAIPVTWTQMVAEYMYWAQMGWEVGSITTLNPAAKRLSINRDSYIVQPMTLRQQNFVLNQNLYPIQSTDLSIVREDTAFTLQTLNQGDAISYGQFNISNFEHGIVFNNVTLFNDIIYNLITGLRQNRVFVRGAKTAEWNGTVDAYGFILNQDNIKQWSSEFKYTKGEIVLYKNRYWSALTIVQAKQVFDEMDWKEVPYNEIQKGLLPNSQTRSYESSLYYNVDTANLENDADLLSFSLIGYRPRDYLATANLTDITQVNVYKNMIKEKGTLNAASAFKGATLPQGGIDYDIYENWAIKSGEFGGVLNNNFIEVRLQESLLTGNPSIVGLTNGVYTDGVQQEIPLYSITNYGRPINSPDVLPTISPTEPSTLLPTAGYVNYNDVKMSSYFYSGLANARNAANVRVPINQFYVRDYVWLANYLADWQVYTPVSLGSIVQAKNNLNGTVTITFSQAHNLTKYQLFAILNFNVQINNYYIVAAVVDPFKVIINLSLSPTITTLTGQGVGFRMQSQRVATAPEVADLPSLIDNEFNKLKVWVDTNNDGSWAVYRKSLNYQYDKEILRNNSQSFGSAVAYTSLMGYLIGDANAGEIYRYAYDVNTDTYVVDQTITEDVSFGSNITYVDDIFVVSQPTGTPKVYVYQLITTTLVNEIDTYQTAITAQDGSTNWGSATALSGDKNWLYISATDLNRVYVYRLSSLTNEYELSTYFTVAGITSGDQFGYSLATDYYGDTVVIGSPYQNYDVNTENYGYTYVFARTVQNFEVQNISQSYVPQAFPLSWTPATLSTTANTISSNAITLGSVSGLSDGVNGTPIVFTGTPYGGISANTVYYVKQISGSTVTLSLTRNGTALTLTNSTGTMTANGQTTPLFINVNGTLLADNDYAVVNSTLYVYSGQLPTLNAGDIVNVSGSNFVSTQTLTNEETPRVGVEFGTSVDTNNFANEILVGAPFELNDKNQEGAVHRYTNGGEKYGIIIGTENCNITTPRTILLNGYSVTLPVGNATTASNAINAANITNVTSTSIDGKLVIELIDMAIGTASNKLSLSVLNSATLGEMGVTLFTQTQKILCTHVYGPTQFGTVVKFNEQGSFVASAPTGTRYTATTFDFSDDETDNDTVFDNNATQWVDTFTNAGAVYMFDYLSAYNESLNTPGKFVYAQSTNAQNLDYGAQPMYGQAIDFNSNRVIIGTPNFNPTQNAEDTNGQVISYISASSQPDWAVYRSSAPIVDVNKIGPIQLFSASTNNTLENLDYFNPLQGKLLGAVQENIDVISNVDPAAYNNPGSTQRGLVWGASQVGQIWFNTSNTRFVNYHQNDIKYNSQYWGRVFAGSDVAVCTWIASDVQPAQYTGPGTPFNINSYAVHGVLNNEGIVVPIYYYWVRNTNIVFDKRGKTLADSTIQTYIAQPQNSGISYFSPLQPDIFALYNCDGYINANDTILHIGYASGSNDDVAHDQYSLIRAGYADDFLDGIPGSGAAYQTHNSVGITQPIGLYNRMLDSLSGVDTAGAVVPNPFLPKAVQSGILARPRQSFFYNRYGALKNYLEYANTVLAQFPIIEIRNPQFLYKVGEINPSTGQPFFDTKAYWERINWWAPGYNDNTRASLQVPIYADLATLDVAQGTIVTVASNSAGNAETYVLDTTGTWNRIGLENGTIKFSNYLWDYSAARLGWGDNFFDTTPYDEYPSEETRYIIRSLNEEIYTNELLVFRNKSLILLFEYIQSETIESQNYLPWLNKTSFIDVAHTIRELRPIEVFQSDYQDFLSGYLNEVKPYHVVIKEFLYKYTGTDVFEGDITDFDLPAQWNPSIQQFVSPQLVYSNPNNTTEFLPSSTIWNDPEYYQWRQNYGLSIVGELAYPIAMLESYVSLNSNSMYVDNATGFPVTGTILIGTELISYNSVDLATNQLLGLSRGINGTPIELHIPGQSITIDLPPVLVLNSGRAYANPPLVRATIDTSIYPAPRVPAQLEPIMNLDKVIGVNVINPGEGYVVLPTITIEPAFVVSVPYTSVNINNSTIELASALLQSGDSIIYNPGTNSTKIGGLSIGQHYYVGLLETTPSPVIALYTTYGDSLYDRDRVILTSTGTGTQTFSLGAYASCVTSAVPVRENNIALRFDRTSYTSQVTDWAPASFYGAFYAGAYSNQQTFASSSIRLFSTNPPIGGILAGYTYGIRASDQGGIFQILDTQNDQSLTWSSRTRDTISVYGSTYATSAYRNAIRINPSEGGSEVAGQLGSTIGFYVGMPIKFVGSTTGTTLVSSSPSSDVIYYIRSLVDLPNLDNPSLMEATGFTISDTVDENGNPGAVYSPLAGTGTATIPSSGLTLYVGQLTNQAVLTINYVGLRNASATSATNNSVTVDLTVTGQDGTSQFYAGLPIFFVGEEFGGIVQNKTYYVNAIVDKTSFTMTTNKNPSAIICTSTSATGNLVTTTATYDLNVNDPVIFNNMGINDNAVSNFGNIISGSTYYIREIVSSTTFTLSTSINGPVFALANQAAGSGTYAPMLLQTDVVQLTTDVGNMQLNVDNALSPGQINGQQFTLYGQLGPFINVSGTTSNLIDRIITSTLAYNNRVCLATFGGGTTGIYTNMKFNVNDPIGNLTTSGGPYTVTGLGTTAVNISATAITTNWLTVTPTVAYTDTTAALYEGMPIYFSNESLGGVSLNTVYYVHTIGTGLNAGKIKISEDVALGSVFNIISSQTGSMIGTGENYITVSDTLVDDRASSDTTKLTQYVDTSAEFNVGALLGGYTQAIVQVPVTGITIGKTYTIVSLGTTTQLQWNTIAGTSGETYAAGDIIVAAAIGTGTGTVSVNGTSYAVNNVIKILGTELGGTSPANDLQITVLTINQYGGVLTGSASGTPAGVENKYYLKVINEDQLEVYSDPKMTVAVSGQNFPYQGATITTATSINGSNEITITSSVGFDVNDPIVFTGNVFGNVALAQTYYIKTMPTSTTITLSNTLGGSTVSLSASTGTMTMAKFGDYAILPQPFYFSPSIVKYNNQVYQCVVSNNDTDFILGKWELLLSGNRKLNALDRISGYYKPSKTNTEAWNQYVNMPGDDMTQLVSGITYPNSTYLGNAFPPAEEYTLDTILTDQPFDETNPTVYNVQGDAFTAGYGPEELVPGVVTDTLTMTVATRPGTNWDATIYQHVGYNVVSVELTPTSGIQTEYSFANAVETPAQIAVFVIDYGTGLSTSIYNDVDYTVNWVDKIVTLNSSLAYVGGADRLRIDVYETGNGDQLVKANTETDPIRDNTTTGFQEIYVNANYTAGIYQGSGVIRPTSEAQEVIATSTSSISNAITCENVDHFVLNGSITFSGAVFGGIVEDQIYYVKSISYATNRITISDVYTTSTGTAGATFLLTDGTGVMDAIIQVGTGTVWTPPSVFHNGTKIVLGQSATVTRTKSITNTITCITTGDLVVDQVIRFSNTIFGNSTFNAGSFVIGQIYKILTLGTTDFTLIGATSNIVGTIFTATGIGQGTGTALGGIIPLQPYYVKTIVDGNEFTISSTVGGDTVELTDATGGAIFISGDYAIGLADNGISASILLANEYDTSVDYITYTLFGQTLPVQYGYTIPEVQTFNGNGSTAQFMLDNYVGDSNITSAIVEINGVRQTQSSYTISANGNTLTFNSPPPAGSLVAITSYNLTDRQYFNTQYGITGGSTALATIVVSNTSHVVGTYDQDTPTIDTFDENSPNIVLFDQELNYLTLASPYTTADLQLNYPIVFRNPTLGGLIAGQIYYVTEILNSTDFVISTTVGGMPTTVTTDSGSMTGVVNGLTVANIININNNIEPPSVIQTCSETIATGNLIVCSNTSNLQVDQLIIFKAPIFASGSFNLGSVYQITELGTTTQLQWNTIAGTTGVTYAVGDQFTCANAGTGTGQALLANVGGVDTTGTYYFINSIASSTEFTIKDQYGTVITLTDSTDNMVAYMAGNVAIRVETGINHNLTENALVRLDGILGSTQLNNNTYYAKIITNTLIYLYEQPYNPALSAVNYPVTYASNYISGGYVWIDQLFTVADTYTKFTTAGSNRITVEDASGIIPGTPVYFTTIGVTTAENILGNIEDITEYYVLTVQPETLAGDFISGNQYQITVLGSTNWAAIGATTVAVGATFTATGSGSGTGIATSLQEFTISTQRYPDESEFVLADAVGSVAVSQFQQVNVDRLWVTINGYRVPSSSLRINEYNNLSILATIATGDEVIITSMMPTATPNEEVYLLNVSTTNQASVYRANTQTRTWLVQPLRNTDSTIYLNDASHITDNVVQTVTAPPEVDGTYTIGLTANKNAICHLTVYNNNPDRLGYVDPANYKISTFDTAPVVVITSGVLEDDDLTITTTEGRLLFINGEQIGFNECDLTTNTVTGLTRGANGTGEQTYIPLYSEVYGIIPNNRMTDVAYAETWNSYIYNPVEGDPLQISQTVGANFLKVDIN